MPQPTTNKQLGSGKVIPLFFWSERNFSFKEKENYGDLLSEYLVEKISGRPVKYVHPRKQPWYRWNKKHFLAIGSILHHATIDSIIWGSGIIDRKQQIPVADFRAVRGPRTRQFLVDLGYECPEIYGDPALLLPLYYHPEAEKKYKVGVIPHYLDYEEVSKLYKDESAILVIDMMTLNIEEVTRQLLECEKTISSSLHGIIVSHAYQIPSVWVEFSHKLYGDGIKFIDYMESVELPVYQPEFLKNKMSLKEMESLIAGAPALPEAGKIKELSEVLLKVQPF